MCFGDNRRDSEDDTSKDSNMSDIHFTKPEHTDYSRTQSQNQLTTTVSSPTEARRSSLRRSSGFWPRRSITIRQEPIDQRVSVDRYHQAQEHTEDMFDNVAKNYLFEINRDLAGSKDNSLYFSSETEQLKTRKDTLEDMLALIAEKSGDKKDGFNLMMWLGDQETTGEQVKTETTALNDKEIHISSISSDSRSLEAKHVVIKQPSTENVIVKKKSSESLNAKKDAGSVRQTVTHIKELSSPQSSGSPQNHKEPIKPDELSSIPTNSSPQNPLDYIDQQKNKLNQNKLNEKMLAPTNSSSNIPIEQQLSPESSVSEKYHKKPKPKLKKHKEQLLPPELNYPRLSNGSQKNQRKHKSKQKDHHASPTNSSLENHKKGKLRKLLDSTLKRFSTDSSDSKNKKAKKHKARNTKENQHKETHTYRKSKKASKEFNKKSTERHNTKKRSHQRNVQKKTKSKRESLNDFYPISIPKRNQSSSSSTETIPSSISEDSSTNSSYGVDSISSSLSSTLISEPHHTKNSPRTVFVIFMPQCNERQCEASREDNIPYMLKPQTRQDIMPTYQQLCLPPAPPCSPPPTLNLSHSPGCSDCFCGRNPLRTSTNAGFDCTGFYLDSNCFSTTNSRTCPNTDYSYPHTKCRSLLSPHHIEAQFADKKILYDHC